MNSLIKYAPRSAQKVVIKIISRAIEQGFKISVYDGEEWTLKQSSDFNAVLDALATTDHDVIRLRNSEGGKVGSVTFVYSNHEDCLSDWSWYENGTTNGVAHETIMDNLCR